MVQRIIRRLIVCFNTAVVLSPRQRNQLRLSLTFQLERGAQNLSSLRLTYITKRCHYNWAKLKRINSIIRYRGYRKIFQISPTSLSRNIATMKASGNLWSLRCNLKRTGATSKAEDGTIPKAPIPTKALTTVIMIFHCKWIKYRTLILNMSLSTKWYLIICSLQ